MTNNQVNIQSVLQILSRRVANLVTEISVLEARNIELEQQIQQLQSQLENTIEEKFAAG